MYKEKNTKPLNLKENSHFVPLPKITFTFNPNAYFVIKTTSLSVLKANSDVVHL